MDAESLVLLACTYYASGDYMKAKERFLEAQKIEPKLRKGLVGFIEWAKDTSTIREGSDTYENVKAILEGLNKI